MPTLKRDLRQAEERTTYGPYEGPEPGNGVYRAVIFSCELRGPSPNGNYYFNVGSRLEAPAESPRAQYNGFPNFTMVTIAENDVTQGREKAFYKAIAGKDDVVVDYDEDTRVVKKIGGVNPVGRKVMVQLKSETYEGVTRAKGDSIYVDPKAEQGSTDGQASDAALPPPAPRTRKTAAAKTTSPAAAPSEGVTVEPEQAPAEEKPDYHAMTLPALKKYAREQGVDATQPKAAILAALDEKLKEPTVPSDQELLEMADEDFWAFAHKVYGEDVDGTEPKSEIIQLLIEDGKAREGTAF